MQFYFSRSCYRVTVNNIPHFPFGEEFFISFLGFVCWTKVLGILEKTLIVTHASFPPFSLSWITDSWQPGSSITSAVFSAIKLFLGNQKWTKRARRFMLKIIVLQTGEEKTKIRTKKTLCHAVFLRQKDEGSSPQVSVTPFCRIRGTAWYTAVKWMRTLIFRQILQRSDGQLLCSGTTAYCRWGG